MRKDLRKLFSLMFAVGLLTVGCSEERAEKEASDPTIQGAEEMKYITVQELDEESMQIIDTRHTGHYLGWETKGVSGHIKNAIDFPAVWFDHEDNAAHLDIELQRRHIDKNKKTVLYDNEDLDRKVYDLFVAQGFTDLYALKGGIVDYAKNDGQLERLEGYQRFVTPEWVEGLVNGKRPEGYNGQKYKIVELSLASEKEEFTGIGHIKGAVNIDADALNHVPGPRVIQEYESIPMEEQLKLWGFPEDQVIREVLENAGIDKDTMVILYATEKATTAAYRAGLVMDYAGVSDIRFINGGKPLWILEGRTLEKEAAPVEKVSFGATVPQNPGIVFSTEQELALIEDPNAVIASVRSFDEYLGKLSGYTYIDKAGDIKNSRFAYAGSDPYAMEDYRNPDNTMFNYKIVADRWKLWGIVPEKTVSFHCGTGWRASETYYIAKALGWDKVGVYADGWYEWTKLDDAPVKEEGLPSDAPEQIPQEFFYKKK